MGRERANVDACRNNNSLQTIHCIIGWYGEGVKEVVKYALLRYRNANAEIMLIIITMIL